MRPFLHIATTAMVAALVAATPGAARQTKPEAKVIGPDESCVTIRNIRQTKVYDDRTIDFVMNGNKVYRNTLPNSCPQLGFEQAFSYQTSQSQLCSVDIITVLVQSGGIRRGASCGLGKFTPVEIAPTPKK